MVRPPSVIVLMVMPSSEMTVTPATSESGIARAEMRVVRTLPRKRARTKTTKNAPSRSARVTLSIATSMKSACRKFSFSSTTPSGSEASSRSMTLSIFRVSSRVLALGCFCTDRMIAGRAR